MTSSLTGFAPAAPADRRGAGGDGRPRVAVVGSGVSGLTAAYALREDHVVRLFEAEAVVGGHVKTVEVEGRDGLRPVDTGFIVYNERTYPRFMALLAELGVPTQPTDMSLSVACRRCRIEFSTRGARGFFAGSGVVRPAQWSLLRELFRFYRDARATMNSGSAQGATLGQYLDDRRFGAAFRRHFIVPLTSAVWSTAADDVLDFPADYLLHFLDNHGILEYPSTVQWRTLVNGSMDYVRQIVWALPPDTVRAGHPVTAVLRRGDGVTVVTADGHSEDFDAVVMATHADTAASILRDADDGERSTLQQFQYSTNDVVLHTDERLLPRHGSARAAWNVEADDCRQPGAPLTMSYSMNRLQSIPGATQYITSVNPGDRVRADRVISARAMSHPMYTFGTLRAQERLVALQGHRATWYAGAHLGYGFHEDGCRSGFEAAAMVSGALRSRAAA